MIKLEIKVNKKEGNIKICKFTNKINLTQVIFVKY